jgi:hypothetical protein
MRSGVAQPNPARRKSSSAPSAEVIARVGEVLDHYRGRKKPVKVLQVNDSPRQSIENADAPLVT